MYHQEERQQQHPQFIQQKHTPEIVCIVNQKGGVGKTTTAINLATAMAAIDKRMLIIDLDPQGNASTGLGIDAKLCAGTSYSALIGQKPLKECIVKTMIPNVDIIPADMELSGAEIEIANIPNKEQFLKDALRDATLSYDYIFVDCPPALGILTLNALTAGSSVLIPLQCEYFALEGISHLIKTITMMQQRYNPDLTIKGIILTMHDGRNKLSGHVSEDARNHFGEKVYNTVIPRNVRISEAPSHGRPVLMYDIHCAGSKAYLDLAVEIMNKDDKKKQQEQNHDNR